MKRYGAAFNPNGSGVMGGYGSSSVFGMRNTTQGSPVETFGNTFLAAGGTTKNAATFDAIEPLRTGRFIFKCLKIPAIFDPTVIPAFKFFFEYAVKSFSGINDVTLETAEGVSMGPTTNAIVYPTIVKNSNNDFTIQSIVTKGGGVIKLLQYWIYGISDPMTGFATMNGKNIPFHRENYGATFIYILLGPTARPNDIEYAAIFHNAFPTNIPESLFDAGALGDVAITPTYDIQMNGIYQGGAEVDILAQNIVALWMGHSTSQQDEPLAAYMYNGYMTDEIIRDRDFQNSVGMDINSRNEHALTTNPDHAIYSRETLDTRRQIRDIHGLNTNKFEKLGDANSALNQANIPAANKPELTGA